MVRITRLFTAVLFYFPSLLLTGCDNEDNVLISMQPIPSDSIKVSKMWDNGKYCSFTSLVKYDGLYYCAFREGMAHMDDIGIIRILVSSDAIEWKDRYRLSYPGYDLRDPDMSITPDGKLMLMCGLQDTSDISTQTVLAYLANSGGNFSPFEKVEIPLDITEKSNWLWRSTWFGDTCYSVRYGGGYQDVIKSANGKNWSLVKSLKIAGANEAKLDKMKDGRMVALFRTSGLGKIGYARSPYDDWTLINTNIVLQGQSFVISENERIICVSRGFNNRGAMTALYCSIDDHLFAKLFEFPSGGDTGYASIIVEDDRLLVSYYSTHERQSVIYLAEIPMKCLRDRGILF